MEKSVNVTEIMLGNILSVMEGFNFSKDMSATIVGGTKKLERLVAAGKIEAVKESHARNGKWKCNAAQVLRHCRDMRTKRGS
ncbi:MAG: hypothetical protein K2M69_05920 [Muribaculaceae bacterium]|nr:hypothetical protein [Muribaculaceae bacterium]